MTLDYLILAFSNYGGYRFFFFCLFKKQSSELQYYRLITARFRPCNSSFKKIISTYCYYEFKQNWGPERELKHYREFRTQRK